MDKKQELAIKKEVKELSLDDFIGNSEQVEKITGWLNDFYSGNTEIKYVSIVGASGNGKTYLARILADEYEVELMTIGPWDIESRKDLNDFMKSINLASLDLKKTKIILIDCMDEFHHAYKKRLLEIRDFSIYPVIYTSIKPIGTLKNRQDGLFILLERPTNGEMYTLLKKHKKYNLSDECIRKIAEDSPSVRSALNSLKYGHVNPLIKPYPDRYEIIDSIRKRELKVPITRKNFRWIWESIQGAKSIADLDDVMTKFADFNYRIYAKNEDIDPFFVNNMKEPVERIMWQYRLRSRKPKVKK